MTDGSDVIFGFRKLLYSGTHFCPNTVFLCAEIVKDVSSDWFEINNLFYNFETKGVYMNHPVHPFISLSV